MTNGRTNTRSYYLFFFKGGCLQLNRGLWGLLITNPFVLILDSLPAFWIGLLLLVAQLVKNPPAKWENRVRSLSWEDLLQYSGLKNSMVCIVHGVAKSQTWQSHFHSLLLLGLPSWLRWSRICLQCRRPGFSPWIGKIPLEKGIPTHSNMLAWRIPWTEEPGSLWSVIHWVLRGPRLFLSPTAASDSRGVGSALRCFSNKSPNALEYCYRGFSGLKGGGGVSSLTWSWRVALGCGSGSAGDPATLLWVLSPLRELPFLELLSPKPHGPRASWPELRGRRLVLW